MAESFGLSAEGEGALAGVFGFELFVCSGMWRGSGEGEFGRNCADGETGGGDGIGRADADPIDLVLSGG